MLRYLQSIILQGFIYIFQDKLGFYSYFNNKNWLFGSTSLTIPFNEIAKIEKRSYAFIDTAICVITTNKIEYTFVSVIFKIHFNLFNLVFVKRQGI